RPLPALEYQRAVVGADDRVALLAQLIDVPVIRPHILGERELPEDTGATHECSNATFHAVFRRAFGQRWSIGSAAPNHPPPIHVGRGVTRIHPPDVRAKWNRIAVRVHFGVVEIIVALRVRAEGWIVLLR